MPSRSAPQRILQPAFKRPSVLAFSDLLSLQRRLTNSAHPSVTATRWLQDSLTLLNRYMTQIATCGEPVGVRASRSGTATVSSLLYHHIFFSRRPNRRTTVHGRHRPSRLWTLVPLYVHLFRADVLLSLGISRSVALARSDPKSG